MTDRAHLYRPVLDTAGNLLPDVSVALYEPGTTTPITDPVYLTNVIVSPVVMPHVFADGVISLYLGTPRRVRVGATAGASPEVFFEDIDVGSVGGGGGSGSGFAKGTGSGSMVTNDLYNVEDDGYDPALANGNNTLAIGPTAVADGDQAIAIGSQATAKGSEAQAFGESATAYGDQPFAIGNTATAGDDSLPLSDPKNHQVMAVGVSAEAIGSQAHADGNSATSYGTQGVAVGNSASVTSQGGTAIGNSAVAGSSYQKSHADDTSEATAVGNSALASGDRDTVIGATAFTRPNGSDNTVVGAEAFARTDTNQPVQQTVVIGSGASATDDYGVAIGSGATAKGGTESVALGISSLADGQDNTALGRSTMAVGNDNTAVGARARAGETGTPLTGTVALGAGAQPVEDYQGVVKANEWHISPANGPESTTSLHSSTGAKHVIGVDDTTITYDGVPIGGGGGGGGASGVGVPSIYSTTNTPAPIDGSVTFLPVNYQIDGPTGADALLDFATDPANPIIRKAGTYVITLTFSFNADGSLPEFEGSVYLGLNGPYSVPQVVRYGGLGKFPGSVTVTLAGVFAAGDSIYSTFKAETWAANGQTLDCIAQWKMVELPVTPGPAGKSAAGVHLALDAPLNVFNFDGSDVPIKKVHEYGDTSWFSLTSGGTVVTVLKDGIYCGLLTCKATSLREGDGASISLGSDFPFPDPYDIRYRYAGESFDNALFLQVANGPFALAAGDSFYPRLSGLSPDSTFPSLSDFQLLLCKLPDAGYALDGVTLEGIASGPLAVSANVIKPGLRVPRAATVTTIVARADTVPTGSDLVFMVERWNNGGFANNVGEVTITAGQSLGVTEGLAVGCAKGDLLRYRCTQVGSGNPGADVLLSVDLT